MRAPEVMQACISSHFRHRSDTILPLRLTSPTVTNLSGIKSNPKDLMPPKLHEGRIEIRIRNHSEEKKAKWLLVPRN
jgi:hypothetical protein